MEFMERDEPRGRRQQDRTGQEQCGLPIETEPLPDIKGHWAHGSESSVLHDDEDQRVAKSEEKRRDQENDRFHMVAKQRDALDRYLEPPVDELPQGVDVIGEIERPIFKIRPTGIRDPGANHKKHNCQAEDRSFAEGGERLRCGHYPCPYPRSSRQTSLSGVER